MAKKYKCPYCQEKLIRKDLIKHIDNKHEELIPEGFDSAQVVYDLANHTKGAGRCRVCGNATKWNSSSGRYDVLCDNPKCKEYMRNEYKKNMIKVHGTYNILNDPEQQKKMLANRSISGKYKFKDGEELTYTGSYERKFLEFADKVMDIPSKDIMAPGPTLEYELNGKKHIYITDFLYIPYNAIIEIKDGGDNPNNKDTKGMRESRKKTLEKEKVITDKGIYNYIRLTNNNFVQLLEFFMDIKQALLNGDDDKVIKINESYIKNNDDIYYNKNKFDSGEINLCFITGHSGSGKSTMAHKNEGNNVEAYELDDAIFNWNFTDNNLKEYGDLYYSFFKGPGKRFKYKSKEDWLNDKQWDNRNTYVDGYEASLIKSLVEYAINYAKSHKDKKYILEGIWIFQFIDPKDIDEYAVYIKGTSMIISKLRAAKRDSSDTKNKLKRVGAFAKQFSNNWKDYFNNEEGIIKFRDYFASKLQKTNESK